MSDISVAKRIDGKSFFPVTGEMVTATATGTLVAVAKVDNVFGIYTTDGNFDINKLANGDLIEINGFTNSGNNGLFKVEEVSGNDIKVLNAQAVDEMGSGTLNFRYKIMGIHITEV